MSLKERRISPSVSPLYLFAVVSMNTVLIFPFHTHPFTLVQLWDSFGICFDSCCWFLPTLFLLDFFLPLLPPHLCLLHIFLLAPLWFLDGTASPCVRLSFPLVTLRRVVCSEAQVQSHQRGAGPRPERHDFHVNGLCSHMPPSLCPPVPKMKLAHSSVQVLMWIDLLF